MKYVSLHSHSTYSYMDGYGLPEEHVERVKDLGMSALALTEHGNVSSHVKLEQAAQKHGVKPIYGIEAYTAPADMRESKNQRKWHMIILAENLTGYRNLMRMVTTSWRDDNYRWPTVLGYNLARNQQGLILLSGCADSHINCVLLGGKGIPAPETPKEIARAERDAEKVMLRYAKMFSGRYFLECQRFEQLERTCEINPMYEYWSKKHDIPLVATSDVHYPRPEQNEMQKILHAAGRNTGTVAAAEAEWEYDILLTYPESDREVFDNLRGTGLSRSFAKQAILNTARIADRCNVDLPKMDRIRYVPDKEDLKPWV